MFLGFSIFAFANLGKVHPHGTGAVGGNQDMSRTKGGSTQSFILPWIRMACRSGLLLHKVQQQIALKQWS